MASNTQTTAALHHPPSILKRGPLTRSLQAESINEGAVPGSSPLNEINALDSSLARGARPHAQPP